MSISTGVHKLGPDSASLLVKTYRQGLAAKAGHDLVFAVTRWEATVDVGEDPAQSSVELSADPKSLEIREALHGAKALSDKDRADIQKNIEEKVLGGEAITFRSTAVEGDAKGLSVTGDLAIAGRTRPVTFPLEVGTDGEVTGSVELTQSEWGIKPYSAMMGALKVRDSVDVVVDGRLPSG